MSTCRPIGTIRCENRLLENNREQESTSSSVLTSYAFTVTDVKLPSMKFPPLCIPKRCATPISSPAFARLAMMKPGRTRVTVAQGFSVSDFMGKMPRPSLRYEREVLSRVLPRTAIHERCKVPETWLEVRGNLGTYRIALGWDGAALVTDTGMRWLKIPRKLLDAVSLDLIDVPIELDYRTETILRKAYVLADDWKIDSPELVRQLMPD